MKVKPASSSKQNEKFTKALASVLSVSPERIRENLAQAKPEKPSPHQKYTYSAEEGQS